jgi:hypothetical protein
MAAAAAAESIDFSGESVRVAVRVRPLLPHEVQAGHTRAKIEIDGSNCIVAFSPSDVQRADDPQGLARGLTGSRKYVFDAVLPEAASQGDVADRLGLGKLVDQAVLGFNASVFAYGQTGSGSGATDAFLQFRVR